MRFIFKINSVHCDLDSAHINGASNANEHDTKISQLIVAMLDVYI